MILLNADERLRASIEAFLWTSLAQNNPYFVLSEEALSEMAEMVIDGGVTLAGGRLVVARV